MKFGIESALLQADGFTGDVFHQAPAKWEPQCSDRVRKLKAPAYGLGDAPAAFLRSSKKRQVNSDASMKRVGLRRQASTSDPCFFFIFRGAGSAAGAFTTHTNDILRTRILKHLVGVKMPDFEQLRACSIT